MKKKKDYGLKIVIGIFCLLLIALVIRGVIAASVIFPYQGGTGTGDVPTTGQTLIGDPRGYYEVSSILVVTTPSNAVGINDISPDSTFEVVSQSGQDVFMLSSTASNDGDIFIVDSSGNVGIGDNDPDAVLEVTTSSGAAGADYFMISNSESGDGDLLIVDDAGNVGIGTATPSYRLQVNGAIVPESAGQSLGATGLEWNLLTADITFANSFIITEKGADAIAWLNPNGKEIMSLDRNGNLLVNGTVEIKGINSLESRIKALEDKVEKLEESTVEQTWWDKLVDYFKK